MWCSALAGRWSRKAGSWDCSVSASSVCAWRAAGSPASDQSGRRTQAWQGTDRQVRGRLLAVARAARPGQAVGHDQLVAATPDEELRDPRQRERCLASLIEDGLLEQCAPDLYRLPA